MTPADIADLLTHPRFAVLRTLAGQIAGEVFRAESQWMVESGLNPFKDFPGIREMLDDFRVLALREGVTFELPVSREGLYSQVVWPLHLAQVERGR